MLNALEQQSATTFRFKVCNQGDISTGEGRLNIVLESNEGQTEERTYKNVTIPSGACTNFSMYAVDGYTTAAKRKNSVVATINFNGVRRELRTTNNQITLAPKKSSVSTSDSGYKSTGTSKNPVADLWGTNDSGTKWYNSNTNYTNNSTYSNNGSTTTNSNCNNGYYNNGTYYNGCSNYSSNSTNPNGDFNPANPTWSMQYGARNIVYVYTGIGSGGWYTYTPNSNGNYLYSPYNPNTSYYSNGYYYNNDGSTSQNSYNTFTAGAPARTNTFSTFDLNGNGDSIYNNNNSNNYNYNNSNNSNSTYYNPWNYNTPCSRWVNVYNTNTQTNDLRCSNETYNYISGSPDLYMNQLKQNGGRSEFIGKICNQGDQMTSSQQLAVRLTNGQYTTTASTFVQLLRNGCADITIPFGDLNLNWTGNTYLLYAELDIYNNISEVRRDNNASYWRIQIQ